MLINTSMGIKYQLIQLAEEGLTLQAYWPEFSEGRFFNFIEGEHFALDTDEEVVSTGLKMVLTGMLYTTEKLEECEDGDWGLVSVEDLENYYD